MSLPQRILVLTGSGISAESGISTFRSKDGLWSQFDFRKFASVEGFVEDPAAVQDFYNVRRKQVREVEPNAAHDALARLQRHLRDTGGDLTLVTQNVDDLHSRAGADTIHMHGEILKAFCNRCPRDRFLVEADLTTDTVCSDCGAAGTVRPDVVWFGEIPYRMEEIGEKLAEAEMFVSIGTSGSVYPAAGFVQEAKMLGLKTVELNLEASDNVWAFDEAVHGPAGTIVPDWAAQWGV